MYEVETIQIDEDNRLVVRYDDSSENPREWGWPEKIAEVGYRNGYLSLFEDDDDPVFTAMAQFNENYEWSGEQVERAVRLYMHLAEDTRVCKSVTVYQGRNVRHFVILGETDEHITGFMDVYSKWLNGEVYSVHHEKREQWTNAEETATMDTWEEEDSIHGNYLDDVYTAVAVAREYFEVEIPLTIQ